MFERAREFLSVSADERDQRIWYKTTQVYVAEIRRSCTEALSDGDDPSAARPFRTEAERGAEIVRIRRGAGSRVGASEGLLNEMEEAERLLREAAEGYAEEGRLSDKLNEVEARLEDECP